MGAPAGNQFARKAKVWEQAIKRALARASGESVDKGLDRLADQLVAKAAEGDGWALKEIGDRMDGKAVATTELSGPDGRAVALAGLPWNHVEPAPPEDR